MKPEIRVGVVPRFLLFTLDHVGFVLGRPQMLTPSQCRMLLLEKLNRLSRYPSSWKESHGQEKGVKIHSPLFNPKTGMNTPFLLHLMI